MNHRLGTKGLNVHELEIEAAKRNMSLNEVTAMPEIEGWIYEGIEPRDGLSYVCSAYVTALYKRAGIFNGMDINSPEFVPRDIYLMNIFDDKRERPE